MTNDPNLDHRLATAFDAVRAWDPAAADLFPAVVERARRRQAAHRALAAAGAVMVALGLGVAVAAAGSGSGDGGGRVEVGDGPSTSTSSTAVDDSEVGPDPTTSSTVAPAPRQPVRATSSTTSSTSTTSTTRPPAVAGPPDAFVSAKGAEVEAEHGSSCWKSREGEAGLCRDVGADFGDDAPMLQVSGTEVLTVRWTTASAPKAATGFLMRRENGTTDFSEREPFACEGGNPCRISLRAAPGEYVLVVNSWWQEGDASYAVRLLVQ